MTSNGDCFVVLPPNSKDEVIFGRNSAGSSDVAQEICFYNADCTLEGETDGGLKPEHCNGSFAIILQKPKPKNWGGDFGSNEKNVCIGIAFTNDIGSDGNCLSATDIVRLTLASASSAENAVEYIGSLISLMKGLFSFIICDPTEAWSLSCGDKVWAAQRLKTGFHRLPKDGLAVTTTFDKSSDGLADELKNLGLWNGEGELNFAACFKSSTNSTRDWPGDSPIGEGLFGLTNMFETLRNASASDSRSASVSVLSANRISCHWFTGTPFANESVFKPFIFSPNPKISPLTKVLNDSEVTLLHKLHAQRKPTAIENLTALEVSCIEEVNKYLLEHPIADEELDELMKDCVEAEVKFYR